MYAVDAEETIHIYYERKPQKRPFVVLPLVCALFCLLGIAAVTLYSAEHPYYEHDRLVVPAHILPPQTFTASAPIVPTGVKTYLATTALGTLIITNGSVIAQILPAGFTSVSNTGVSVVTDRAVFVPAGNANGYGYATVSAHTLISGKQGNIPALAINSVIGSSLYIRNLSAFTGGRDSYSVKFVTVQDKQTALLRAQDILLSKTNGLHYPCSEDHSAAARKMIVTWRCQFIRYTVPPYMHVTAVRLSGKNLVIDVFFVLRPARIWVK